MEQFNNLSPLEKGILIQVDTIKRREYYWIGKL